MASVTREDIAEVESPGGGECKGGLEVNGTFNSEVNGKPYRKCNNLKVNEDDLFLLKLDEYFLSGHDQA